MNKNLIIESLYLDKSFKKICLNIAAHDYSEDLYHETILILLSMDDEKIIQAKQKGYLKFMFIKIATNLYKSKSSPFFKKYRHLESDLEISNKLESETKLVDLEFEKHYNQFIIRIEKEINILSEYERELLKLYLKFNDYRKVSIEVGIKYESVRHAIRMAIAKIKNKNEKYYNDIVNEQFNGLCD
jgi:DNA-binding CsgD family transcriptional regulator